MVNKKIRGRPVFNLVDTEPFNWNDGRLITLTGGQAAKCENLIKGQIYAVLIYNSSQFDVAAIVTVVWSNDVPPTKVTVRGTTGDNAPASFLFVSGNDTDFISISLAPGSTASIETFVASVSMPLNPKGINNAELPNDSQFYPFEKYDRYYIESATGWREINIQNLNNQFICLQMLEDTATVIVVNKGSGITDGQIYMFGSTANQSGVVQVENVNYQTYTANIQGNSGVYVWINGDSGQNSKNALIALQQLSLKEVSLITKDFE